METIFVSGIGTDIGKTVVCAVLCKALNADYWKPIQAGSLDNTDSAVIAKLAPSVKVHPERYILKTHSSPHYAAAVEGINISVSDFTLPKAKRALVIEGAGGLMVPISDSELVIDLINHFKAHVVLVSHNYLGSINHTLLSIDALTNRSIPIRGIVFNGPPTPSSEEIILKRTGVNVLGRIEPVDQVGTEQIATWAKQFAPTRQKVRRNMVLGRNNHKMA